MPLTPVQIKDKLTNALDDEKNVVDEKAVEEVITLLEASTITKEILEQTRLGRDINHVRKICKNAAIAKRAKNLVRAWKQLITVPGSPLVPNGQHPAQRISPGLPTNRCLPSPALVIKQPQQKIGPCSPVIQTRLGQPALTTSKLAQEAKSRIVEVVRSPKVGHLGQLQLQKSASINVCEDSNLSWPHTPPSVASDNSSDRLIGDSKIQDSSAADRNCQTSTGKRNFNFDVRPSDGSIDVSSKAVNRASDQRDVSKTNVANRKRTRTVISDDSNDLLSHAPSKQPHRVSSSSSLSTFGKNDVINGSVVRKMGVKSPGFGATHASFSSVLSPASAVSSSSKNNSQDHPDACLLPNRINQRLGSLRQDSIDLRLTPDTKGSREKLGKVKTTEQLIEDMQKKSATPVGTTVIAQIRTNQIEKESDTQRVSLPRGVMGRGRKKKAKLELLDAETRSEGGRLAQAKSEYIERFLQTSVPPTPGEDGCEQSHLCPESLEEQPMSLAGCSSTFVQSIYDSRQDKPDSGPSASPPEARDILEGPGHLPSTITTALDDSGSTALDHLSTEQILARLPPIDFDNIDWTSHDYPSPQPVQVSEALIDRLHHDNLEGINGTYDRDGQFRRWPEMLTVDSVSVEPLHILPYVILD
ncbi:hypothetical protein BsWGS_19568 [Bradybaena similaris]